MVPQRWSHVVWAPPGHWCHEMHSSSHIRMRTWCTWSPVQTSVSRTYAVVCWAREAARATRHPRPLMAVSCCVVAVASIQHRWSWPSAAAAGSTGAASSSADSASGSWRCTHAGDVPSSAQHHLRGPGKANNLNISHHLPQEILVVFLFFLFGLVFGSSSYLLPKIGRQPQGHHQGAPQA